MSNPEEIRGRGRREGGYSSKFGLYILMEKILAGEVGRICFLSEVAAMGMYWGHIPFVKRKHMTVLHKR